LEEAISKVIEKTKESSWKKKVLWEELEFWRSDVVSVSRPYCTLKELN
jgi:hypothetical protein